ncbi:craniofacial development protein 2-like [Montipora capricornis]|uniref:craniofacial development protein 2-like n=1 Tax=Montipora capricornis TaxID=246305 RepID=UPI0035F1993C
MSRKDRTLIEWKPSGSRLLKARFNSKYTKLTVIMCYAPIEDAEEADKNAIYEQLQAVTDKVPTHDLLMVLGDLNARPGNNNIGRDRVMGKHGIGTINDNGERLCHFCDENNMVIGDVRVYRGADVASDHNLLVAVVSLKLRRARRGQRRGQQFHSRKLRDDRIRQAFRQELKKRFQILGKEQEMNVDSFNQAFKAAGEKVLGFRKRKRKEWIQGETWEKIKTRRVVK